MVTIPYLIAPNRTFRDSIAVGIKCPEAGAIIFYTLDGSEPTSKSNRYSTPITLHKSTTVKAVAVVPGKGHSFAVEGSYIQVKTDRTIAIESKVSRQYTAGGPEALIDGIRGAKDFRLGGWQGYQGQNFEAVIDMASVSASELPGGESKSSTMLPSSISGRKPVFKCG